MYPDSEDIRRVMKNLSGVPKPTPEFIWQIVVLARGFLFEAGRACKNHGRHALVPAEQLRAQAEAFVGQPVSPYEFCVALLLVAPTPTLRPHRRPIDVSKFETLEIKFPPTERMEEYRERWTEVQKQLEAEIEREKIAQSARRMFQ